MEEPLEFLHSRPIGVLATVDASGTPHAVPVEVIVDDGKVYAWCHRTSAKARNAERAGLAALTAYKGAAFAMVRGPARLIGSEDPTFARVTEMFLRKYDREETYGNDVLIEISPASVATS